MEPIEELFKNIWGRPMGFHEGLKLAKLKHSAVWFFYFIGTVTENKEFGIRWNDASSRGVGYASHVADDQSRMIEFLDLSIGE